MKGRVVLMLMDLILQKILNEFQKFIQTDSFPFYFDNSAVKFIIRNEAGECGGGGRFMPLIV